MYLINIVNNVGKNYEFAKTKNLDAEKLSKRGEKISKSKKEFYSTEEGKKVSKSVGQQNKKHLTGRTLSEERKQKQSKTVSEKIKNGEFNPGINNNFTNWEARYIIENKIYKFRSSWELCVGFSNPDWKFEIIKIPYFCQLENKNKTYIADFFDEKNNTIYEIKPTKFFIKQKQKMNCIIDFCLINNIKFIWINENNILQYVDINKIKNSNNHDILNNFNMLLKGIGIKNAAEIKN